MKNKESGEKEKSEVVEGNRINFASLSRFRHLRRREKVGGAA